jgi:thiamine biosynthesis lipoprotein
MSDHSSTQHRKFNRRDFLKITAISGLSLGVAGTLSRELLSLTAHGELRKVAATHSLMGTIVNFVVLAADESLAREALRATVAEMTRLIQIYDHRHPESPLAQLNTYGSLRQAPSELVETLQYALHIGALTSGAFDVTVKPLVDAISENIPQPASLKHLVDYRQVNIFGSEIAFTRPGMSITLDGVAKGSVVDGGVAVLYRHGFDNVLVEAGGDMLARSSGPQAKEWKIGVTHPRAQDASDYIAAFSVQNKAVATSGDYMNFFSPDHSSYHIVDPRSGVSPALLSSATVIAPSAAQADALSTTLMVLGPQDGLKFVETLPAIEAMLVSKDLTIHRSSGFPVS